MNNIDEFTLYFIFLYATIIQQFNNACIMLEPVESITKLSHCIYDVVCVTLKLIQYGVCLIFNFMMICIYRIIQSISAWYNIKHAIPDNHVRTYVKINNLLRTFIETNNLVELCACLKKQRILNSNGPLVSEVTRLRAGFASVRNNPVQGLLHDAAVCGNKYSNRKDFEINTQIMKSLIDFGINVDSRDIYGETALMKIKCNLSGFRYLLDVNADINAKNNYGMNCLHYACERNDIDMIKFIIDNGANVDEYISKCQEFIDTQRDNDEYDSDYVRYIETKIENLNKIRES